MVTLLAVVMSAAMKRELRLEGNGGSRFNPRSMGLLSLFKSKPAAPETAGPQEAAPAPLPAAARSAERWRRNDFIFFAAGENEHLVYLRGRAPLAVPSFALDFLLHCDEFQPMERHLAQHAERHEWGSLQLEALTSLLPKLVEAGLLISAEEIRACCAATIDPANRPAPVQVMGFPTGGNRTAMLERCLTSFGANLAAHGRTVEMLVADSSPLPEQRAAFRTLLQRLKREQGLALRYMGEEEKRRFAAALIERSGCRASSVEFALFDPLDAGFACGANRNAILLHEAGGMVVAVDDDVICEMAPIASPEARVALFTHGDPCFRQFFPDRESAVAAAQFEERDFLAAHETMLGQDIGVLFPAGLRAAEIDLDGADNDILRRIEKKSARIRTTYFGQLGDPGTPTSCYFFYLSEENLARLTASESLYRAAFGNRSVLSGVTCPTIGGGLLAPGMTIGLDHRALLPPFFPVLHAEDMIFAAAASLCSSHAVAGHLPIALHHDSGKNKALHQPGELDAENRATVFEFATIVRSILAHCAPPEHAEVAERVRMLGRSLSAFAGRPRADFLDALRRIVLQLEADKLSFMEERLREETEAPDFWRRDIADFIAHTRLALEHEDFDIPFDLKPQRSDAANREFMQRLLAHYGALLEDWPEIVAAARELRAEGRVFSTEVRAD